MPYIQHSANYSKILKIATFYQKTLTTKLTVHSEQDPHKKIGLPYYLRAITNRRFLQLG